MLFWICDDEQSVCNLMAKKVENLFKEADIQQFYSAQELLCQKVVPNIVLLDIQMPGINGIEAAKMLKKKYENVIIIFITGAKEYVFQAFDVNAFNYLVKPIDNNKLEEVLKKAVLQADKLSENTERSMMIYSNGRHIRVRINDIVYAEVFDRKVVIHALNENIEYYGKLKDLEKIAGEDFFRPHRAYLVHFKYVERYNANEIVLKTGSALMAKQNFSAFVKGYLAYNKRKGCL